jgi:hypothetical protein
LRELRDKLLCHHARRAMTVHDEIEIKPVTTAADVEAISRMAIRALRETNARDYAPDVIDRLAATFTPERFAALVASRLVYIANAHGRIVGTANLDGAMARAVFVDLDYQGQGIGAGAAVTVAPRPSPLR